MGNGNNSRNILDLSQLRAEKCLKEIDELLNQHGCIMVPQIMIRGTEIRSMIEVLAKPVENKVQERGPV